MCICVCISRGLRERAERVRMARAKRGTGEEKKCGAGASGFRVDTSVAMVTFGP